MNQVKPFIQEGNITRQLRNGDNIYGVENILSTVDSIDLKTVGVTNLFAVPSSLKCVVTKIIIRPTTVSGFVSVATLGVGTNGTEDDIMPSQALTGLDDVAEAYVYVPSGVIIVAQPADIIKLGVDTGASATTFIASVDLIGYFRP